MTVPPVVWRHRSLRSTCGRRSRYRAATAPAGAGSRRAGADRGALTDSTAASRSSTSSTGTFPSASLERPDRTVSRASDARNRYKIRYTRNQERLASLQVKTHDRVFGTHPTTTLLRCRPIPPEGNRRQEGCRRAGARSSLDPGAVAVEGARVSGRDDGGHGGGWHHRYVSGDRGSGQRADSGRGFCHTQAAAPGRCEPSPGNASPAG